MTAAILLALGLAVCAAAAPAPPGGPKCDPAAVEARLGEAGGGDSAPALILLRECREAASLPAEVRARIAVEGAEAKYAAGDFAGARAALNAALSLQPEDPEILLSLAERSRDLPERALPLAERSARAAASPRRRAAALRLVGEIRLDLDDEPGARAALSEALRLAGDELDTLRALTWAWRERPDKAAGFAARACRAALAAPEWRRAASLRRCAAILMELRLYERAADAFALALEAEPYDLEALRELVDLRRRLPGQPALLSSRAPLARARAVEAESPRAPRVAAPESPVDLDAVQEEFDRARYAGRTPEASRLAAEFFWGARRAPSWARLDAYRESVRMASVLGDPERVRAARRLADVLGGESLALFPELPGRIPCEDCFVGHTIEVADTRLWLGDPAGARAALERALGRHPRNPTVRERLVRLELALGRTERALKEAEALSALCEGLTPEEALARGPVQALGSDRGDASERNTAALLRNPEARAEAVRRLEAERAAARRALADARAAAGSPRAALAVLDGLAGALASRPPAERAGLELRRAQLLRQLGEGERARSALERALALAPDAEDALRELAQLLTAEGRGAQALGYVERLAAVVSSSGERDAALREKARIELELGDRRSAKASLESAVALGGDLEAAWRLGSLLAPAQALAVLESSAVARAQPRAVWLAMRAAAAEAASPGSPAARKSLAQAIALDAKAACFDERLTSEPNRLPLSHFDACIGRFAASAVLFLDRGVRRHSAGDAEGAIADFRRAVELEPRRLEAALSLASALSLAGRRQEALAATEQALRRGGREDGVLYSKIESLRDFLSR